MLKEFHLFKRQDHLDLFRECIDTILINVLLILIYRLYAQRIMWSLQFSKFLKFDITKMSLNYELTVPLQWTSIWQHSLRECNLLGEYFLSERTTSPLEYRLKFLSVPPSGNWGPHPSWHHNRKVLQIFLHLQDYWHCLAPDKKWKHDVKTI